MGVRRDEFIAGLGVWLFTGCGLRSPGKDKEKSSEPNSETTKRMALPFTGPLEDFVRFSFAFGGSGAATEFFYNGVVIYGDSRRIDRPYILAGRELSENLGGDAKVHPQNGELIPFYSSNDYPESFYGKPKETNTILVGGLNEDGSLDGNRHLYDALGVPRNLSDEEKVQYLRQHVLGHSPEGALVGYINLDPTKRPRGNCLALVVDHSNKILPLVDKVTSSIGSTLRKIRDEP